MLVPLSRHILIWKYREQNYWGHVVWTGGVFSLILTVLLAYGQWVGPLQVKIVNERIDLPQLNLDRPLRIVAIADAQWQSVANKAYLEYVVNQVNLQYPDLIVWLGDLVEKDPSELTALKALQNLQAKQGKFAVLGNHDYYIAGSSGPSLAASRQIEDFWTEGGFVLLRNAAVRLQLNQGVIGIGGVESSWFNQQNHAEVNNQIETMQTDFNILLSHEPTSINSNANTSLYQFGLAGHCHGGQVDLPIIGAPIVPPGCLRGHIEGWQNVNGLDTYITSGIGTGLLRLRLGAPAEITVIDIY